MPPITTLTNGMPMLGQHVGANSALAKTADTNLSVYARRGITISGIFSRSQTRREE